MLAKIRCQVLQAMVHFSSHRTDISWTTHGFEHFYNQLKADDTRQANTDEQDKSLVLLFTQKAILYIIYQVQIPILLTFELDRILMELLMQLNHGP